MLNDHSGTSDRFWSSITVGVMREHTYGFSYMSLRES